MALARSKLAAPVFPFGTWTPTNAHGQLPAARAWRVIARPAADFAAGAAAVVAGVAPAAPSGALDGAYPVWVRLTDPGSRSVDAGTLLVDGDGWNLAPTGPGWRVEVVGPSASPTARYCYVVETVADIDEAGQVNAPPSAPASAALTKARSDAFAAWVPGPGAQSKSILTVQNARGLLLTFTQTGSTSTQWNLNAPFEDGYTDVLLGSTSFGAAAGRWFGYVGDGPLVNAYSTSYQFNHQMPLPRLLVVSSPAVPAGGPWTIRGQWVA